MVDAEDGRELAVWVGCPQLDALDEETITLSACRPSSYILFVFHLFYHILIWLFLLLLIFLIC